MSVNQLLMPPHPVSWTFIQSFIYTHGPLLYSHPSSPQQIFTETLLCVRHSFHIGDQTPASTRPLEATRMLLGSFPRSSLGAWRLMSCTWLSVTSHSQLFLLCSFQRLGPTDSRSQTAGTKVEAGMRTLEKVRQKQGRSTEESGKGAWPRAFFPAAAFTVYGRGGEERVSRGARGLGPLCPRGWALAAWAGQLGQWRRRCGGARREGLCAARPPSARGLARSAPARLGAGIPGAGGSPAALRRTMATDSKCPPAAEARSGRPRDPGAGSFPLPDARLCARLAGAAARCPLIPLPITLCYPAGLGRRRWLWPPVREGCGRRTAGAGVEGTRDASGPAIEALRGVGGVSPGPGPAFRELSHPGTASFSR